MNQVLLQYRYGVLRMDVSFFDPFDRGARVTRVTMPTARYLALGKFSKILRIEIENYSHHHDNGNVSNRTSMDIDLFNTNLLDGI
jgi:hypothetical protein